MPWGEVELEPEVSDWFGLSETDQARVRFHVDRLAELGPLLDEPHTRQLDGKLRELRFYLVGRATRITYWIAPGRRVILLTVFVKPQRQEVREIRRAQRRCNGALPKAIWPKTRRSEDDGQADGLGRHQGTAAAHRGGPRRV